MRGPSRAKRASVSWKSGTVVCRASIPTLAGLKGPPVRALRRLAGPASIAVIALKRNNGEDLSIVAPPLLALSRVAVREPLVFFRLLTSYFCLSLLPEVSRPWPEGALAFLHVQADPARQRILARLRARFAVTIIFTGGRTSAIGPEPLPYQEEISS